MSGLKDKLQSVEKVEAVDENDAPHGERGETIFSELHNDEGITVQRVTIPADKREDPHYHDADTYIYHLQGEIRVSFQGNDGQRVEELGPGEGLKIPAYVVHKPVPSSNRTVETVAIRLGSDVETTYV